MARPKSFVKTLTVDQAGSSHNCKNSSSHRIYKGDARLKLRVGRSSQHYCVDCALRFIERDISKLEALAEELRQAMRSNSTA